MICGHTVTSLLQGALVIPWKHLLVEVKPKCPCHDLKLKGTKAVPQELEAEMALLWPAITKLAQRYRDATEERDKAHSSKDTLEVPLRIPLRFGIPFKLRQEDL
jgi:hypothetical protein